MPVFGYRCLVLLAILFILTPVAHADTLLLKNGDRISGTLLEMSPKECNFKSQYQSVLRIPRNEISQIDVQTMVNIILVSGECLKGTLTLNGDGNFQVQSAELGELSVASERVVKVVSCTAAMDNSTLDLAVVQARGSNVKNSSDSISSPALNSQPVSTKRIGQEPNEEDIRLLFLRGSSVLLKPGEAEIELDAQYSRTQREFLGDQFRYREFSLPMSVRYGLFDRAEGFLSLPYKYSQKEVVGLTGDTVRKSDTGIGDLSGGLKYMLASETPELPEVVVSLTVDAPTGKDPYENGSNPVPLGSGHWAVSPGIEFMKIYDPVVVFWGLDYTHQFERQVAGQRIAPGDAVGYNFGMGFAVNENISLSTQFSGLFQTETQLNGSRIPGSTQEPMSLRMALTNRINKNFYIEPSIMFGLNNDATDSVLGVSFVRQFGEK
jgi:hypothetical protein